MTSHVEVLEVFHDCLLTDYVRGIALSVLQRIVAVKVNPVGYRDPAETGRGGASSGDKRRAFAFVQPLCEEFHLDFSHPEHRTVAVERIFSKVQVFESRMDDRVQDAVTDRLDAVIRDVQVSKEWQLDDLRRDLVEQVSIERQMLQFGKSRKRSRRKDGETIVSEINRFQMFRVRKDPFVDLFQVALGQVENAKVLKTAKDVTLQSTELVVSEEERLKQVEPGERSLEQLADVVTSKVETVEAP